MGEIRVLEGKNHSRSQTDEESTSMVVPLWEKQKNLKDITNYLQIVLAHRMYQRAMCRFKFARYVMGEEGACVWLAEAGASEGGKR